MPRGSPSGTLSAAAFAAPVAMAVAHLPAADLPLVLKWPASVALAGALVALAPPIDARRAVGLLPAGALVTVAAASRAWSVAPWATDRFLAGLAAFGLWIVAGAGMPPAAARWAARGLTAAGLALVGHLLYGRLALGAERYAPAMGNPNFLASYLAAVFALAAAGALASAGRARIGWTAVAAVAAIALGDLESRGALAGAALGGAVAAAAARRKRTALAVASAVPIVLLAAALALAPGRVAAMLDPASGTIRFRLETWVASLAMVAERPWTGWGAGAFAEAYPPWRSRWVAAAEPLVQTDNAHSEAVQWAVECGLPGAAVAGWFAVTAVATGLGAGRPGPAAGFAALAASNLFGTDLRWGATTWALGLLCGLSLPRSPSRAAGRAPRPWAIGAALSAMTLAATAVSLAPVVASVRQADGLRHARAAAEGGAPWRDVYRPAAEALDGAISLDPRPEAIYFRANLEADAVGAGLAGASGVRAAGMYRRCLALAPFFTPARLRAATIEADTGARVAALRRAIVLEPFAVEAWTRLADLLHMARRHREAAAAARRLADLRPGEPRHAVNAAFALLQAGETPAATRALEQATVWYADSPEPAHALGVVRFQSGDRAGAAAAWRRALAIDPNHAPSRAGLAAVGS